VLTNRDAPEPYRTALAIAELWRSARQTAASSKEPV